MKDSTITHEFYVALQDDIDRTERLQEKFRRYYYGFRLTQVILTAVITVLSGVQMENQIPVMVLGVIVTASTAIETLFKFDTKKDALTLILFDYRSIRDEFIYNNIQNNISQLTIKDFYERYRRAKDGYRSIISNTSLEAK